MKIKDYLPKEIYSEFVINGIGYGDERKKGVIGELEKMLNSLKNINILQRKIFLMDAFKYFSSDILEEDPLDYVKEEEWRNSFGILRGWWIIKNKTKSINISNLNNLDAKEYLDYNCSKFPIFNEIYFKRILNKVTILWRINNPMPNFFDFKNMLYGFQFEIRGKEKYRYK